LIGCSGSIELHSRNWQPIRRGETALAHVSAAEEGADLVFLDTEAMVGAGTGAVAGALTDYGIDDDFIRDLAKTLNPNSSAIFILVRKMQPEKVLSELSRFRGKVLRTSLPPEQEARLQAALSGVSSPRSQQAATERPVTSYRLERLPAGYRRIAGKQDTRCGFHKPMLRGKCPADAGSRRSGCPDRWHHPPPQYGSRAREDMSFAARILDGGERLGEDLPGGLLKTRNAPAGIDDEIALAPLHVPDIALHDANDLRLSP
jgi:hypothetical protein